MITTGEKRFAQPGKYRAPIMIHLRRLAVHQLRRAHDASAKRLSDRLMAQTDTKQRNLAGKSIDHGERNTGVVGGSRPGRDDDAFRTQTRLDLVDRDLIVSTHLDRLAQLTEILDQVVSERIVV